MFLFHSSLIHRFQSKIKSSSQSVFPFNVRPLFTFSSFAFTMSFFPFPSDSTRNAVQTFTRWIIFYFSQFPISWKKSLRNCLALLSDFYSSSSSSSCGRKWESSLEERAGWKLFTEMAYLVRSTVDVNELQFIVSFLVVVLFVSLVSLVSSSSSSYRATHRLESSAGVEITCRRG